MRRSIRSRILLLTVATLSFVVTAMAAFVWWKTDRSLRTELDNMLHAEAMALAGRVEVEHGKVAFEMDRDNPNVAALNPEILVQVISENQIVFSSSQLE